MACKDAIRQHPDLFRELSGVRFGCRPQAALCLNSIGGKKGQNLAYLASTTEHQEVTNKNLAQNLT